jgi:hypothetical protein
MMTDNTSDEMGEILGQELARWRGLPPIEDYVNADDLFRTLHPRLEALITHKVNEARIKDLSRWLTAVNIDNEIASMRMSKELKRLKGN